MTMICINTLCGKEIPDEGHAGQCVDDQVLQNTRQFIFTKEDRILQGGYLCCECISSFLESGLLIPETDEGGVPCTDCEDGVNEEGEDCETCDGTGEIDARDSDETKFAQGWYRRFCT